MEYSIGSFHPTHCPFKLLIALTKVLSWGVDELQTPTQQSLAKFSKMFSSFDWSLTSYQPECLH